MDEREFHVSEDEVGERIDRFLARLLPEYSRNQIQSWIRGGRVKVDGERVRVSHPIESGERIDLQPPDLTPAELEPLDIPLDVIHEDPDFLVLVKPAGLQVHPGAGPTRPTLVQALLHRYPDWRPPGAPDRPGVIHRLDRDTSGLMLVARTPIGFQELGRQIRGRQVRRRYITLLWGSPDADAGTIDAPIGRHPRERTRMAVAESGRPALTQWRILRRYDALSLVEVILHTGRTHQIRVHFGHLGYPVFGDPVYGDDRSWIDRLPPSERPVMHRHLQSLKRQALHAYHLTFQHPVRDTRLRFEAPLPDDMDDILIDLTTRERKA